MLRPAIEHPPEVEELSGFREPAGPESARLDISGIAVELTGLPADLAAEMARAYHPYLSAPTGADRPLRISVTDAPIDYFLPPGFAGGWEVYRMLTDLRGGVFRSVSYRFASWFDVARREGQMALGHGALDPASRAMENFLRSAVAWLALDRGGFFLHGASIVRDDRCYLFYGPSGAGKSTLSAMSRSGKVNSDDLTLVLHRPEGLLAAGGPFRGTYRIGAPILGTFPVAGFYRLRKDERVSVDPDEGGCFADLIGNLPFVVDQLPGHPHLIDQVRAVTREARFRTLRFNKDDDFWPAIDAELTT